jgi:hypothetical protein
MINCRQDDSRNLVNLDCLEQNMVVIALGGQDMA